MHGLIFKTSIYYRQDQPGSYHLSRTSRRKLTPSYAHTTTCMHRQSRPRLSAHLECCCSKALKLPRRLAEKWLSHLHTHRNAWSVRTCHPSRLSNLRLQYGLAGNPQSARTPQLSASSSVFSTDTISSISHYCGYQRKKTSPARTVRPWPLPPKRLINVVSLFLSSCKPASKHCGQHNTMHSRTHTQIPETTPPARKQTRQPTELTRESLPHTISHQRTPSTRVSQAPLSLLCLEQTDHPQAAAHPSHVQSIRLIRMFPLSRIHTDLSRPL